MAKQMHAWPATKFIGGSLTLCGADRKCLGNEAPNRACYCVWVAWIPGTQGMQGLNDVLLWDLLLLCSYHH